MKRYRNFVEKDINRHLYCSICQEVFYKPSRATCGHTFCKPCIAIWANIKQNCPLCRKKIKKSHFEKDLLPSKMIDELKIYCPSTGCQWQDKCELLQNHLKACKISKKQQKINRKIKSQEIIDESASQHGNIEQHEYSLDEQNENLNQVQPIQSNCSTTNNLEEHDNEEEQNGLNEQENQAQQLNQEPQQAPQPNIGQGYYLIPIYPLQQITYPQNYPSLNYNGLQYWPIYYQSQPLNNNGSFPQYQQYSCQNIQNSSLDQYQSSIVFSNTQ